MSVDVIIPVYAPDEKLNKLVEKLLTQTVEPSNIIIMHTLREGEDGNSLIGRFSSLPAEKLEKIVVKPVARKDYGHGATRNIGASFSKADRILFMTQDAVPKDDRLIENLCIALDKGASAAFARQEAYPDADITEKLTREFNYPGISYVRSYEDIEHFGIKTFFCSDTCMIYDKATFDRLGGFDADTVFAEDMLFANRMLKAGGKLAYASEAVVYHSHDLTAKEQFWRNYDNGVNQAAHPEIFKNISSEKEGVRYVKFVVSGLKKAHRQSRIIGFLFVCAAKYLGFWLGKHKKH